MAVAICLFVVICSNPLKAESKSDTQHCNLILGWHIWPPFQYLDEQQKPIGFQIELIKKLDSLTGCKLELRLQSFSQNIKDISQGRIDMTMDTTITDERSEFGWFSVPYRREMFVLYVKAEKAKLCRDIELPQLLREGFKMSVSRGVLYGDLITDIQQDTELNSLLHYSES
ncbi:MAG: transporter substrate-binding domain-containing protein, partial [Kangiellaceae bacterium]|nr:transporter substrate-binding domain-containing protein [Kangiellaceae bacterium]